MPVKGQTRMQSHCWLEWPAGLGVYPGRENTHEPSLRNGISPWVGCVGCPMAGKQRYREFRIFPTYERAYRRAFAKMLELRKAAGRQCNSRLWSDVDAFFRWWMEDPGIPGQYELSFHEDTMRFIMTICSGREEELSQNINYLLDCSMKPGCWKSVFRTGWSFLLRSRH